METFKPGLHIVVRVAEHDCDDASKRILKPLTYRLQMFLVRDQYLRSLLPHGDQTITGQLEKHVLKPMLAILTTYIRAGFRDGLVAYSLCELIVHFTNLKVNSGLSVAHVAY